MTTRAAAATAVANANRISTRRESPARRNHSGAITLDRMLVTAVVDGDLPRDSIEQLVSIS